LIKLKIMRYVGHVARVGHNRDSYRVLVRGLIEGENLKGPGVDGRIILK
jgi:hypothetical protein